MKFQIVDAFTDCLFGGNPAGIVILPENGNFPPAETMRKTAAELRYSETAFIKPLGENRFQTRYFTPVAEVELCGHATVGGFHALRELGLVSAGTVCLNETKAGPLHIFVDEASVQMDMAKPRALEQLAAPEQREELYRIMGLPPQKTELLPQKISTGLPDILLPVADEAALDKIAPDFGALAALSERYGVVGVHAFTCAGADGQIHARNFAPLYGIDEEAATGTSNGALIYYLYQHGLVQCERLYTVVQGEKMGRPSRILARVCRQNGEIAVKVGGSAVTLARGEIEI